MVCNYKAHTSGCIGPLRATADDACRGERERERGKERDGGRERERGGSIYGESVVKKGFLS